jgi:hypothetical protein
MGHARHIKRRRSTKGEIHARRRALCRIVAAMRPMTVRQVFYQASVVGIVEKTEAGYRQVQNDLVVMRREGFEGEDGVAYALPYDWITDSTRWQRKPRSFNSPEDALAETAKFYRRALWSKIDAYVEIWLEKDALAGVVFPITAQFDVPLMVARGYASLSFLHSAAEAIAQRHCPAFIYHLGDFDPSGVNAGEKIEETLRDLAPTADIYFERIAVTPDQIRIWSLPTRPTKASDSRAKGFDALSVELDAIEPGRLRDLVREAIEQHLPGDQFEVLKAAEESERAQITGLIGMLRGQE